MDWTTPKNCLFPLGSGPLSNTWFFGPTWHLGDDSLHVSHPPNGISIGSAVFAGLTNVTNRQTGRQINHANPSVLYSNRPHLAIAAMRRSIIYIIYKLYILVVVVVVVIIIIIIIINNAWCTYVGLDLLVDGRHDHLRRRDGFQSYLLKHTLLMSPTGDDVTRHVAREQVRFGDRTSRGTSTFCLSITEAWTWIGRSGDGCNSDDVQIDAVAYVSRRRRHWWCMPRSNNYIQNNT